MKPPPRPVIAAALACALLPAPAPAQEEEPLKEERQTVIESERLSVENDGDRAYFLFTGNVEVEATNLRLESDRLEVFATREAETEASIGKHGSIERILATGNVRIEQAERVATAGRAEVLVEEERILLTENPVVSQAGGRLTGPELVIERGAGRVIVKGDATNKVRLTGPAIRDFGFEPDSEETEPESEEGDAQAPAGEAPAPNPSDAAEPEAGDEEPPASAAPEGAPQADRNPPTED